MAGIALLALGSLTTSAAAQAIEGSLHVRQGKARFAHQAKTGEARHRLSLQLVVGPTWLPDLHNPAQHTLRAVLDETVLFDVAPGAQGYRSGKNGRWRYRGNVGSGRVKVSANPLSGRFKIKLSRATLPNLRDSNAKDLRLTLEMGGMEVDTTASFTINDGGTRSWKRLAREFVPGGGGGAGGGDPAPTPDPGGAPQQVSFSILRRGNDTSVTPRVPQVARSQSEWAGLWAKHDFSGSTPPTVNFSQSMVVGIFLGIPTKVSAPGYATTVRVVSINDSASRREVVWEQVPNGGSWTCPPPGVGAPCILPAPYEFVLASKSSVPVTFREQ